MTHTFRGAVLPFLIAAALASTAWSHDFWIRPSSFRPGATDRIEIDLRVGEGFRGEAVARNPSKIDRFVAVRKPGAEEPIVGIEGKAPAGFLRAAHPKEPDAGGALWIVYRSKPSFVELQAEKFESYLAEEGLEHIVKARQERNESSKAGRELYSRCAKSLVCTGPGEGAGAPAQLGLPLEILPEGDISRMRPGEALVLQLVFRGRPVEGLLVGCESEKEPEKEVRRRTDAEGRVRFEGVEKGVWLVRAVHMVRAADGLDADWESFWASLTFEVGPCAPAASGIR
ncbi:MAG: DUF4198 domain-containing protein [Planctomycetota bacterium]